MTPASYTWPPNLPDSPRFVLRAAAVPGCLLHDPPPSPPGRDGLVHLDIELAAGRVAGLRPAGAIPSGDPAALELAGNQVWPCFVDLHTHLDKGHTWPRVHNAEGTFAGAIAANVADREANWSETDVEARMSFALRCAWAHGTAAMRTHLDSPPSHDRLTWSVFARLREAWRGRIELQAASIVALDRLLGPFGDELAERIAAHRGVLGGMPTPGPTLRGQIDRAFELAARHGLDLDFHADESGEVDASALREIARARLRHRFAGRVVVGHCCSLAVKPQDEVERTLDEVAHAGLAVVSLPACNLHLQDRVPGRTPRWRGVTLLKEMHARGIPVAIASDNTRDPFHDYGDLDVLEAFGHAVRIAHLDHPIDAWPGAVTRTPAQLMRLDALGALRVGAAADLVIFNARSFSELLARPQSDRVVLRAGRPIPTKPPSYRELDARVAPRAV